MCIPPNQKTKWIQQGVEYDVIGPDNKELHSYEKCYNNVIKTLENKFNAPAELRFKEIYAFSFYYDRLNTAKAFPGKLSLILDDLKKKKLLT